MANTSHPRSAAMLKAAFAFVAAMSAPLVGAASVSADPPNIPDPHLCDPALGYCVHIPLEPAGPAPFVDPDGYWVDATNPHPPVAIPEPPPIQTEWTATPPPGPPDDPFCDFATHVGFFGVCATGDAPH